MRVDTGATAAAKGFGLDAGLGPALANTLRVTANAPPPTSDGGLTGRQLVICCDGTNNTLTGGRNDTNVVRLVEALSAPGRRREDQVVYYDPGVGSPDGLPPTGLVGLVSTPLRRMLGLALGRGIYENVGEAYLFLCHEYGRLEAAGATTTTDEIYVFGFSRGAFTARCAAGMVNLFGLIRPEHEHLLPTLLNVYFSPTEPPGGLVGFLSSARGTVVGPTPDLTRAEIAAQVRRLFTTPIGREARVHFLGVWDTVQSVGLPGLRKEITSSRSLRGKRITHTRHAMSIDEHRRQFLPRFFTGPLDAKTQQHPAQTLRQLWFRGVHADIGGGGASPMSRIAYDWMIDEAAEAGLQNVTDPATGKPVRPRDGLDPEPFIGDQLYKTPWWALTGMAVRAPEEAWSGTPEGVDVHAPPVAIGQAGPKGEPLSEADREPQEHWSVSTLSPPPGRKRGPSVVSNVHTPWQKAPPTRLRGHLALLMWALWGVAWLAVAGALVRDGWAGADLWPPRAGMRELPESIWMGLQLEWAQLRAIVPRGWTGDDPMFFLEATHPRLALLAGLAGLAGWTYLVARLATRCFSAAALWRRVGQPPPLRAQDGRLGNVVAWFVCAGLLAAVLHLLALSFDAGHARNVLLVLGAAAAITQWVSVALVGVLAGRWVYDRIRPWT